MTTNTDHLDQCIKTLEASHKLLLQQSLGSIEYDVMRSAVIKEFELTLETAVKVVRKALIMTETLTRSVDRLPFKEALRTAAKHDLLDPDAVIRWFAYRDNRNETAHDYGVGFAEKTLTLVPDLIADAKALSKTLGQYFAEFS